MAVLEAAIPCKPFLHPMFAQFADGEPASALRTNLSITPGWEVMTGASGEAPKLAVVWLYRRQLCWDSLGSDSTRPRLGAAPACPKNLPRPMNSGFVSDFLRQDTSFTV